MAARKALDFISRYVADWRRARPDLDHEALAMVSLVGHTIRLIEERVEAVAAGQGLKMGELSVLLALRREPDLHASPTELSRSLWVTSGGMTYRTDRLVERGLVRRRPNPADRRAMGIELTEDGVALADRVQSSINQLESHVVEPLTSEERRLLTGAVHKMLAAVSELGA